MSFTQRHLLGLEGLPAEEIIHVLDTAKSFVEISERDIKKVPTLRGKTVVNLFFENSTRTRTSFEIAEKRLSADFARIYDLRDGLDDDVRRVGGQVGDLPYVRHAAIGRAKIDSDYFLH